jgi:nickel-type superoxide dismutase maturation protease
MCRLLRVTGNSLFPVYREGDFVLVSKIPFLFNIVRQGDVVAFRHPSYGALIKRVERISTDRQRYFVVGTHILSTDSRQFGEIERQAMLGKVIWHIRRPRA